MTDHWMNMLAVIGFRVWTPLKKKHEICNDVHVLQKNKIRLWIVVNGDQTVVQTIDEQVVNHSVLSLKSSSDQRITKQLLD